MQELLERQEILVIFSWTKELFERFTRFRLPGVRPGNLSVSYTDDDTMNSQAHKKVVIFLSFSGYGPPAIIVTFHPVCFMIESEKVANVRGSLSIAL